MLRRHLALACLITVYLVGCGGSDSDSIGVPTTASCADGTQRCPDGLECLLNGDGVPECLDAPIQIIDLGVSDAGDDTSRDTAPSSPDAMSARNCMDLCQDAIDCIYNEGLCRALTPGEERDIMAQCNDRCMANQGAFGNPTTDDCSVRAEAIFRQVNDLTLLCGVSTLNAPCRTADGLDGVCTAPDICTTASDDARCLGGAVCCTGITCGTGGTCVASGRCDGRPSEGDCPGSGIICCVAYAPIAGACADNSECASGVCSTQMATNRVTPNGFCQTQCENSDVCGPEGVCLANAGDGVCFQTCDLDTPCREGWLCGTQSRTGADGVLMSVDVCLTDCRQQGCGSEGVCNQETGICELTVTPLEECEFPCVQNEVCASGRCVRPDNSCATEYNCPENWACTDGQCTTASFADCDINLPNPCAAGQTCVQTNDGGGICLVSCVDSAICPLHMSCQPLLGVGNQNLCYYEFCDAAEVNGPCLIGDRNGTCRPLGDINMAAGICLDSGTAAEGEPCDGEANRDTEDSLALLCASGLLCIGDNDDPLDPTNMNDDRGECQALCAIGGNDCAEGLSCVQYGRPDDPDTPENELFNMGICSPSDCSFLGDDCAIGDTCQPIAFGAIFGRCRAIGELGLGEACTDNTECPENSICGNAGGGPTCIRFCAPRTQDCPWGQSCLPINGGAIHACL